MVMRIFFGFDGRDHIAAQVAYRSLMAHHKPKRGPVQVELLMDWKLRKEGRYWRGFDTDRYGQRTDMIDGKPFSTDFSFTRFLVPDICGYEPGWVLFCDPDIMFRADVSELFDIARDADPSIAVICVKHDHRPDEKQKMGGLIQTRYSRKNWSSVMLMEPSRCKALTQYAVNNWAGSHLHKMLWLEDDQIGGLPVEWNWLEGYNAPEIEPKLVHFTRGTPDIPGYENVAYADEWRSHTDGLLI